MVTEGEGPAPADQSINPKLINGVHHCHRRDPAGQHHSAAGTRHTREKAVSRNWEAEGFVAPRTRFPRAENFQASGRGSRSQTGSRTCVWPLMATCVLISFL